MSIVDHIVLAVPALSCVRPPRHRPTDHGCRLAACLVVPWLLLACSGDDTSIRMGDETGSEATQGASPVYLELDCNLPEVLEYCGGGTCHYDNAARDVASGLALWDRQLQQPMHDVEARLLDMPASYQNVTDAEDCPTQPQLLIDSASPEESLLLKKLSGTQACGDEMPKFPYPEWGTVANPGPQRAGFIACLHEWVTRLSGSN